MDKEDIFSFYVRDIYRYIYSLSKDHHLSEDIVQETFYRAYIHLHDFTPENIKPWLFTVAHNLFIDYVRKNKKITLVENEHLVKEESKTNIEKEIVLKEEIGDVTAFINTLPVRQKSALILCDLNDLSYEECAKIMGISIGNFKSILYRARQNIRKWNNSEVREDG